MKIWCFDTKVYNEQDFSYTEGDDITSYKVMGGGGTEFMCNWEYMKDNDIVPKKLIMFTDGYPGDNGVKKTTVKLYLLFHSNRDKDLMHLFGVTALRRCRLNMIAHKNKITKIFPNIRRLKYKSHLAMIDMI